MRKELSSKIAKLGLRFEIHDENKSTSESGSLLLAMGRGVGSDDSMPTHSIMRRDVQLLCKENHQLIIDYITMILEDNCSK